MAAKRDCDLLPRYKIREVAKRLGISKETAYREARAGSFPNIQLRKAIIVPKAEFDAWFQAALNRGKKPNAAV